MEITDHSDQMFSGGSLKGFNPFGTDSLPYAIDIMIEHDHDANYRIGHVKFGKEFYTEEEIHREHNKVVSVDWKFYCLLK